MRRAVIALIGLITLIALTITIALSLSPTVHYKWDPSGSDCPVTLPTGATPCPGV